jgi:hypothetical protein
MLDRRTTANRQIEIKENDMTNKQILEMVGRVEGQSKKVHTAQNCPYPKYATYK